jgi:hypothetical protein
LNKKRVYKEKLGLKSIDFQPLGPLYISTTEENLKRNKKPLARA